MLMIWTAIRLAAVVGGYAWLPTEHRTAARRSCCRVGGLLLLLLAVGVLLGRSKQDLLALGEWQGTPMWTNVI